MASRGKLSGKTLPVLEPAPLPTSQEKDPRLSSQSLTSGESTDSRDHGVDISSSTNAGPAIAPHALGNTFHPLYDENIYRNRFAMNPDLSLYHFPDYLRNRPVPELIRYYDHVVSTIMPWVDGPYNAWRTLMLPLAFQSPCLLLAILALSAEHYSSKTGSTRPTDEGLDSRQYRDKSLELLAQDLRTEISEDSTVERQAPASAVLATILILCNLEMIRCSSAIWRVHWKAARTITRRWTSPHFSPQLLDDTCRFLLKEAFIYNAFGSSTTFDGEDLIPGSVLSEEDSHVFTDWLRLIQDVTHAERCRNAHVSVGGLSTELANISVLQQRFDYARNRSLDFSKTIDFGSQGLHDDFAVLVHIFHYAGLIYSYQALLDPQESAPARDACVSGVIRTIAEIENQKAFEHDLVWPLFVVGTASRGNRETQAYAETKLLEVMGSTGFSNCFPALEFLRRFWATDPTVATDWMQFARQESSKGLTFLVI